MSNSLNQKTSYMNRGERIKQKKKIRENIEGMDKHLNNNPNG